MTVSIGAVTLAYEDTPDDGDWEYGLQLKTSKFNPEGYAGTIVTWHGQPGNRHRVHMFLPETPMQALRAVAAAQAEITVVNDDRPGLAGGVQMAIDEYSAAQNAKAPGATPDAYYYDVWIGMVETGS